MTTWSTRCRGRRAVTAARRSGPALLAVALAAAVLAVSSGGIAHASDDPYTDLEDAGVHRPAVEALAADGILDGTECGPAAFCPGEALNRWNMAVWLVRVVDGAEPPAGESAFDDVDESAWWSPHVNRLADLGITNGCTADDFCPDDDVSRAEIATFLQRAFSLPAASPAGFTDIDGNFHADAINALAAAGVTVGCATGPLRYCPDASVTRAEAATFVYRASQYSAPPTAASPAAVASPGAAEQASNPSQQSSKTPLNSKTGTNDPTVTPRAYIVRSVVAEGAAEWRRSITLDGARPCLGYTLKSSDLTQSTRSGTTFVAITLTFDGPGKDDACATAEDPLTKTFYLDPALAVPFEVQVDVVPPFGDTDSTVYTCGTAATCPRKTTS